MILELVYLLDQHVKVLWNLRCEAYQSHNVSLKDQTKEILYSAAGEVSCPSTLLSTCASCGLDRTVPLEDPQNLVT